MDSCCFRVKNWNSVIVEDIRKQKINYERKKQSTEVQYYFFCSIQSIPVKCEVESELIAFQKLKVVPKIKTPRLLSGIF